MLNNQDSKNDLLQRQNAEAIFHAQKYAEQEHFPYHYSVNPTYPVYQKMLSMLGDLSGKCVLEYGCGEGWVTSDLARAGGYISAFDISEEAVKKTSELIQSIGFSDQCRISQMGGEQLNYPDGFFDIAVGFAIIHHLDLNLAIPELYRVLKPGGIAYFAEPLGGNPVINLYRKLTPQYRTQDEEPIDLDKLSSLLYQFKNYEHQAYYLTALASVAIAYLPFGKKMFPFINRGLMRVDEQLLYQFPKLGRLAWYAIIKITK